MSDLLKKGVLCRRLLMPLINDRPPLVAGGKSLSPRFLLLRCNLGATNHCIHRRRFPSVVDASKSRHRLPPWLELQEKLKDL